MHQPVATRRDLPDEEVQQQNRYDRAEKQCRRFEPVSCIKKNKTTKNKKKKQKKKKKTSFYTFTRKASALNQHKQYIMFLKMFLNS